MSAPPQLQLLRATANTLWWHLQRDAWTDVLETRAISPTGAPRSAGYNSAGRTPGPQLDGEALTPTVEVLSRTPLIRANLCSDDWPGRTAWRILLARPDADRALSRMPAAAITADVRDAMLRGDGDAAMRAALAAWLDVDTGNVTDTADA